MSHLLYYSVHIKALQGQPCLLPPFLCKPLQGNFEKLEVSAENVPSTV